MTFYIDKRFARNHFAANGWILIILGILLVTLFFLDLFFLNLFTFTNKYTFMISMIICLSGMTFFSIGIFVLSLEFYGNLTFFNNGFMIGKTESYGDLLFTKDNTYNYNIIKINNISVTQKFIILNGSFEKSKRFGKPEYFEDKFYKQNRQINTVKIPRIYGKESELLAELNKFLNK